LSKDLIFLSRQYETFELPKEKGFLLKYCETPVQEAFLRYYYAFGNYDHFCDHTGFVIQKRWMKMLLKKMQRLEKLCVEARSNFDLELVAKIESGKYKIRA
jgi:hypothetical protein